MPPPRASAAKRRRRAVLAVLLACTALAALAAARFALGLGWGPSGAVALLLAGVHGAVVLAVRTRTARRELSAMQAVGQAFFTDAEAGELARDPHSLLRERKACPLARDVRAHGPPGG